MNLIKRIVEEFKATNIAYWLGGFAVLAILGASGITNFYILIPAVLLAACWAGRRYSLQKS